MAGIRDSVTVRVIYDTEDTENGPAYVASCDELMFTTDGRTFEELLHHIRECLVLNLRDADSIAEFHVAPDARVRLVMELPADYAETT